MTAHENGGSTMRFVIGVLLILWRAGNLVAAQDVPGAGPCRVTEPNGSPVTEVAPGFYGDRELSVALMWPAGTVVFKPGGPGVVLRDGSLSMKFGWQRGIPGALTIDGHRIDGTALPLRARIPNGYGDIGFQATGLIFPTPGCWEVTGHVGRANVTFVTRVVKIGDGPAKSRDR
jgi:hypothetical protein